MMGTWMQQMAQGWVLTGLTSSALTLGLINFGAGIPMLALTMFGGSVADRHDKRRILIAVMVIQAALAIGIGLLVGSGQIAVWHIAVAGVCLGISTAFEMPAASVLVPELVPRELLSSAIAVDRSIFHATRMVGPALGGLLIAAMGTSAAFFANATSYLALIIALKTIQPRQPGTPAEEEMRLGGISEGLTHVRGDRPTATMVGLLAVVTMFVSPFFMILMPLYSRHVLGIGPGQHGILMGASGVGAVIGSIRLLAIARVHRTRYLRAAALLTSLAMATLALAHGLSLALPAMVAMTLGTSTLFGLANTIVQERAPDPIRGRVSAIAGLAFFGILPFAGLMVSSFADWAGMRTAILSGALCFGVFSLGLLMRKFEPISVPSEASAPPGYNG